MSTINGEKVVVIDIALDENNNLQKITEDTITEVGFIKPYAGSSVPTGYLLCNGAAISRAQYPELFAAIGTTWGAGDGSSTFNVPDLRGYFLRGVGGGQAAALGAAQGQAVDWRRLVCIMQRLTNPKNNADYSLTYDHPNGIPWNGMAGSGNNFYPFNACVQSPEGTTVQGAIVGYRGDGSTIPSDTDDAWAEAGEDGQVISTRHARFYQYRDTETRPMNKAVNYCIRYA